VRVKVRVRGSGCGLGLEIRTELLGSIREVLSFTVQKNNATGRFEFSCLANTSRSSTAVCDDKGILLWAGSGCGHGGADTESWLSMMSLLPPRKKVHKSKKAKSWICSSAATQVRAGVSTATTWCTNHYTIAASSPGLERLVLPVSGPRSTVR
jgi:hypothetical protein